METQRSTSRRLIASSAPGFGVRSMTTLVTGWRFVTSKYLSLNASTRVPSRLPLSSMKIWPNRSS
jgi:hypothetical protein